MKRLAQLSLEALALASIFGIAYFNIYTVPSGYYGLLKERALGFEFPVLKEGRHWLWTGFVPDKWQLYLIPIQSPPMEFVFRHKLRYSEFLLLGEEGEILLKLRVSYAIPEEALPLWLRLTGGEIDKIPHLIMARVQLQLKEKMYSWYQKDDDLRTLDKKILSYFAQKEKAEFVIDFQNFLQEGEISLCQLLSFELLELKIPDFGLYELQSRNIEEVNRFRREALRNKILLEERILEKQMMDKLEREHYEKLAEVLRRYPNLVEYFKARSHYERSLVLPEIDKTREKPNVSGGP
ncbi:MAG: hypothetical protein NZM25_10500 [Leptospiraceae bacterium]|nr:hypothetical protein [Leptospiraceae bacterium]MDW8305857.1 hypothetical protein [Leptospiraceae bacterium]